MSGNIEDHVTSPGSVINKSDEQVAVRDATKEEKDLQLLKESWGALNFMISFYDPDACKYLDTEAWKHAEATARAVREKLAKRLGY